jgi:acyl-CoA reductase-like NAD-dependent aldehyde dehydrogenase
LKVRNPRTGEFDYLIAPPDAAALRALASRMRVAQAGWAARPAEDRARVLRGLGEAVQIHARAIGEALMIDTGRKAISAIEVAGIPGLAARWAASAPGLIVDCESRVRETAIPGITARSRLVPYQLVGVISPWNFPLTLALIDAIPALAAGCAVLIKPSEITPRFIRPLMAAIAEVPELENVLALVEGDGACGAELIRLVDYLAFTGSVATGRKVAVAAAEAFIPASLELGGKDPMIVCASVNPDEAAGIALRASIVNTGQACQSIERVYVARAIADSFITALVDKAKAVRLNYPDIETGDIGPFIFERQAAIVQQQIDDAAARGARVLCGGKVETLGGGLYLRPTVLTEVTADMAIMAEETFGPVIPVTVFDSIDEAVQLANQSSFGLSGAVLAASAEEAEAIGQQLAVGAVSINDGSLTAMIWQAEKSSFGLSGMGPSRMGDSGLMRFFRHQALIRQAGTALPLTAYSEDGASAA